MEAMMERSPPPGGHNVHNQRKRGCFVDVLGELMDSGAMQEASQCADIVHVKGARGFSRKGTV